MILAVFGSFLDLLDSVILNDVDVFTYFTLSTASLVILWNVWKYKHMLNIEYLADYRFYTHCYRHVACRATVPRRARSLEATPTLDPAWERRSGFGMFWIGWICQLDEMNHEKNHG